MVFSIKLLLRLIEFYTKCLSNGPYKKDEKDSTKRQGMQKGTNLSRTLLLLYCYTSDWCNQQNLPKLH